MSSLDNSNWILDSLLFDDVNIVGADFSPPAPASGLFWSPQGITGTSNASVSVQNNGCFVDSGGLKEPSFQKRVRSESCSRSGSKACREKMRRDKLNDMFSELDSILEPKIPIKRDKATILIDATRMVTQLRSEAQKLKDFNGNLQQKIEELKAEKNELRDEKQRLKAEKESLEQQIKMLNARPSFIPHPASMRPAFTAPGHATGHKLMMPVVGYSGYPMWQFMPPVDVDTSQDAESCPPVA